MWRGLYPWYNLLEGNVCLTIDPPDYLENIILSFHDKIREIHCDPL